MQHNKYGEIHVTSNELCDLLYSNPTLAINRFKVIDPIEYNSSVNQLYAGFALLTVSTMLESDSIEEFDKKQQANWHMPNEYKHLDIAAWVLDQCREEYQLQRAGKELLMYQERDLFNLLRYMKYLVDTLRKNNIVWGVGRGSSVASYVLFIIGIHRIDSLFYDLSIDEFLK